MSETPTHADLFSQSFRARLRVSFHAFRAKALFGFQAIPVVQDVCTDEDDPLRKSLSSPEADSTTTGMTLLSFA